MVEGFEVPKLVRVELELGKSSALGSRCDVGGEPHTASSNGKLSPHLRFKIPGMERGQMFYQIILEYVFTVLILSSYLVSGIWYQVEQRGFGLPSRSENISPGIWK